MTFAYDREPPHDADAERAVLGCILINPKAIGCAVEVLGEGSDDTFYIPAHQCVYDAAIALYKRNVPSDLVTVMEELTRQGKLEVAGGVTAIADITSAVPTSVNIEHYAKIVLNAALTRRLIATCSSVTAQAYDGGTDIAELIEGAEKTIFGLSEFQHTNPIYAVADLADDSLVRIKKMVDSRNCITGLPTGYPSLDRMLCGLQPADMVIVAARPSIGKTAFALNIAAHAAIVQKKGALIFTLEMSKEQFMHRLLCLVGNVDMGRLRDGYLAAEEVRKAERSIALLKRAEIHIDESVGLTPLEMRSRARRYAAQHANLGIVIIDYMQLMHVSGKTENRQNEISTISRSIKGLARELHVPVVALSQLSREAERNDDGLPQLSHLRESGSIEQDADVVLMLSRVPKADRVAKPDNIVVSISKQRNGPTGTIELFFKKCTQQFIQVGDDGMPPPDVPQAQEYNHGPTDLEGGGYNESDEEEVLF